MVVLAVALALGGSVFTMSGTTLDHGALRNRPSILLVATTLLFAASVACTTPSRDPAPEFTPTATVRDIMNLMIDPQADAIWDSVVTVATEDGIESTVPETNEEWEALRHNALTLIEATNLLLIEGRRIARAGARSPLPGIDLEPEEITSLVAEDREPWVRFVHGLHESGQVVLNAVEAKDQEALLAAGDGLDVACENCHARYLYPGYGRPREDVTGR